MQFNKVHHPANCTFAGARRGDRLALSGRDCQVRLDDLGDEIFRIEIDDRRWGPRLHLAKLDHPAKPLPSRCRCELSEDASLRLLGADGKPLLQGAAGRTIGVCGQAWLLNLLPNNDFRFYGSGERWGSFERSGQRSRFINTDVWADHPGPAVQRAECDPLYLNIPWLVVKTGESYVGILLDNPFPAFLSTGGRYGLCEPAAGDPPIDNLFFGADDGRPIIYLLVGPSLAELTAKYQRLVGPLPLPPLWALGHHQCRWGYASRKDLEELDRQYRKARIPTDALWLDIDYMDRYQVFTLDPKHWPDPASDLAALAKKGRRVVPILDPGVKRRKGYPVYETGLKGAHFCKGPEGPPYIGFVWPGETHFPDFSQDRTRRWWADQAAAFFRLGFAGAWLDMNDPACGAVESSPMLFRDGNEPHEAFRNQYALGMAMATREGFQQANHEKRPFLLSRSGCTGQARFSANWTGDNCANEAHLAATIPCSLNLALSGIPFNGPDLPGFGGQPTPDLAARWYKAGFLFPFFRNHSNKSDPPREPWRFPPKVRDVIAHCIRLRYKFLPYLYNLFMDQEERGTAILRPLIHDFRTNAKLPLDRIGDQFLVGPAIMQAPCLRQAEKGRSVVLPEAEWFDAANGKWLKGGVTLKVKDDAPSTPLYLRSGQAIPMQAGVIEDERRTNLADIELHLVAPAGGVCQGRYRWDAGDGYGYQRGERSGFSVKASSSKGVLRVEFNDLVTGFGAAKVRLVAYGGEKKVLITGLGKDRNLPLKAARWTCTGKPIKVGLSAAFSVG